MPKWAFARSAQGAVGEQDGFTLLEVMIAGAIMAFSLVAMVAIFPQVHRDTTNAGRDTLLNHLVVQKLEELRARGLGHSDLSIGVHPAQGIDSSGARYYPVPGYGERYSLRWTVSAGPTDGGGTQEPGMRTVVIEATHQIRYSGSTPFTPIANPVGLEAVATTFVTD